ncbi:MAG: NADH-quinone oxidoreductase subunit C [Gemmatimonadaceae bacterium]|nr:NADH-quinone oxidoreductase subunit C [Gemmatimonadaceae bacterium]
MVPILDQLHLQYAIQLAEGDSVEAPHGAVRSRGVQHGTLVLEIDAAVLFNIVATLRDQHAFDMLLDVTAVDWPDAPLRFEVVWHLLSTTHKVRVRLKTRVSAQDPTVDSLTALFGSAGYMERECHDMYGIRFRGNADMRPILLYEGFHGHPLRKDYPKQKEQPLVPYRPPQSALVR